MVILIFNICYFYSILFPPVSSSLIVAVLLVCPVSASSSSSYCCHPCLRDKSVGYSMVQYSLAFYAGALPQSYSFDCFVPVLVAFFSPRTSESFRLLGPLLICCCFAGLLGESEIAGYPDFALLFFPVFPRTSEFPRLFGPLLACSCFSKLSRA